MAAPSLTYTLTNGTTADASQVMQNFNDIINGISDGTKDLSINALTLAGALTANGNATLGNASGDDVTINGSLASSIAVKTTNTYGIGGATTGLTGIYFGTGSTQTARVVAASSFASSRTYTMPDAGANASFLMTEGAQTKTGNMTFASQVFLQDGTAANPGLAFTNGTTTGMYRAGGNSAGFSANGVAVALYDGNGSWEYTTTTGANATFKKSTGASITLWADTTGSSNKVSIDNSSGVTRLLNNSSGVSVSVTQAGGVTLGPSAGGANHQVYGQLAVGGTNASPSGHLVIQGTGSTPTAGATFRAIAANSSLHFQNGNMPSGTAAANPSSADCTFMVWREFTGGRSINAAGTVNASGADYAEYMTKSTPSDVIAPGEVCGVTAAGLLTKSFADSISFVVKSTDPSYVGGDTWFNRARGEEESETEYRNALEAARQSVDRIAFCGQVPVYLAGTFAPGDYVVPQLAGGDAIVAVAVPRASLTLDAYTTAIGQVFKVLGENRALVAVGLK